MTSPGDWWVHWAALGIGIACYRTNSSRSSADPVPLCAPPETVHRPERRLCPSWHYSVSGTPANGIVCERGKQVSLYGRHETCPAFPKRPLSIAPRPLAADRTGGGVLAHAGWDQFDADDICAVRDQLDNGCKRYVPPAFAALTTGG